MSEFIYQEPFPIECDKTQYRLLTKEYVKIVECDGRRILKVDPKGIELLAREAYTDVSFYLRPAHLEQLRHILEDPEASDNDKFVAYTMLLNQTVAAEGELPTCQDTGTAICIGKKGENVFTGADDAECIARGAYEAYKERNLRYSQVVPFTMTEEKNSGTNLPAQIDLYADKGNEYKFLFITKGGGSANKTFLYQQTKALLNEKSLLEFFRSKLMDLGTSACPPYHLAVCIGGTSAEMCLATVKKASAGYLDQLPTSGNEGGRCFRDLEWEQKILQICRESGIGAQFGGKYLVHDVRVIRAPRHAASCPVGIGVSCSADRNIKAKITEEGIFLEQLEKNPARFLPKEALLRRSGQDAERNAFGQLRTHDGRPYGSLRGSVSGARRLADHAGQGQPLATGDGRLPKTRRILPRFDRRSGGCAGQRFDQIGRSGRFPGTGYGSRPQDLRRKLPGLHPRGRQRQRFFRAAQTLNAPPRPL